MAKKKRVLFIIAPKEFRDDELTIPKERLESEGIEVDVASTTTERIKGIMGTTVEPDMDIHDIDPKKYEYMVVIGGPGASKLGMDRDVVMTLRQAKNVGGICLGTVPLATAGLLKDKNATTYETPDTLRLFKNVGATYIEEDVVIDGTTITASGPDAIREFAFKLTKLVKQA